MRLLFVARRLLPDRYSGTETFIQGLTAAAGSGGHQVRIVSGWEHLRPDEEEGIQGVRLGGRTPLGAYRALHRAARAAAEAWGPDVIVANQLEAPSGPWPSLAILHDMNFGGARFGAIRRGLYCRRASAFRRRVAVSHATATRVRAAGLRKHVDVIPPGIDLERFALARRRARPIRPQEPLQVACLGRLHPGKGQMLAVEALRLLPESVASSVQLTIAGATADQPYVERLVAATRDEPRIQMATDVPDLAPYYRAADVVLFPSLLAEGFGYAAAEAIACGIPVLHARQAAISEAVFGGGEALDPSDPQVWAAAISGLVGGGLEAARDRSEQARGRLQLSCGWSEVWRQYEGILEEMIK